MVIMVGGIWSCLYFISYQFKKHDMGVPGWLSPLRIWLLISVQVMISQFGSSSPTSGSGLTVQGLLGILFPSIAALPLLALCLCLSLSQNKINLKKSTWHELLLVFVCCLLTDLFTHSFIQSSMEEGKWGQHHSTITGGETLVHRDVKSFGHEFTQH